jgi:hypothetical protein
VVRKVDMSKVTIPSNPYNEADYYALVEVDFDELVMVMDDDIRELLHAQMAPCGDQEFADAYCVEHYKKYGSEVAL